MDLYVLFEIKKSVLLLNNINGFTDQGSPRTSETTYP